MLPATRRWCLGEAEHLSAWGFRTAPGGAWNILDLASEIPGKRALKTDFSIPEVGLGAGSTLLNDRGS